MSDVISIKGATLALFFGVSSLVAADSTNSPPVPQPTSPVAYFRQLLAMTDAELGAELAKRPESQRAALTAKIQEYATMPASDRELRLRATELRFYLLPMMKLSETERSERLAQVPEEIRELVEDRLVQWYLVPPTFREEMLENQAALLLFSRMHPESPANADELVGPLPTAKVSGMEDEFAQWQALSPGQRSQLLRCFNHFFELTSNEKARTLQTLSDAERLAMEKTLKKFEGLPEYQRQACLRGFQQFLLMPPGEQARFLENVDRWQALSPEDREEWRTVVEQLSQMPPLPPGVDPVFVRSPPPLPTGFVPPVTAQTN